MLIFFQLGLKYLYVYCCWNDLFKILYSFDVLVFYVGYQKKIKQMFLKTMKIILLKWNNYQINSFVLISKLTCWFYRLRKSVCSIYQFNKKETFSIKLELKSSTWFFIKVGYVIWFLSFYFNFLVSFHFMYYYKCSQQVFTVRFV